MNLDGFSIIELEEKLKEVEPVEEKIKLIASEIRRCKRTIQDIEEEATNIDPTDVKLITKVNCNDITVLSILNDNKEIKNAATKELLSFCSKKCCERLRSYLEKAQIDYDYYTTELDLKVKSNGCSLNGDLHATQLQGNHEIDRIIWMCGKEKLLNMFTELDLRTFLHEETQEEILSHFANENQIPFLKVRIYQRMFRWRSSDSSFAVFVNELAERKAIDGNAKFTLFPKHFLNRYGKPFKNLAQKKYYTETYTKTGNKIRDILNSVNISILLICCNLLSSFMIE
jgi:hypothetical protein